MGSDRNPRLARKHSFMPGRFPTSVRSRLERVRGSGAISVGQAIRDSYEVLRSVAPHLTNPAVKIGLAIARQESGFGIIVKSGFTEPNGEPSHNWGAIKGQGDDGCFYHGDADEVGKVCFQKNSSAYEGARRFMKTWGSSDTIAAAQTGDIYGVAKAMRGHHYYTGFDCTRDAQHPWGIVLCAPSGAGVAGCAPATEENVNCAIQQYAQMIKTGVNEVSAALGQPNDDTHVDYPSSTASKVVPVVFGAGLVAGAYYFLLGKGYNQYTKKYVSL